MSIYIDSNQNIKRYFLEIEKYLPQLQYNPYLSEIQEEIYHKKKQYLLTHIDTQYHSYIHMLNDSTMDTIFNTLYNSNQMTILQEIFEYIAVNNIKKINYYVKYCIQQKISAYISNKVLQSTDIRISTMTVCCYLDKLIDLQTLYTQFKAPFNINVINYNEIVPKLKKYDIIGCKYSTSPIKGYFKKNSKSSFYNSASLNIFIRKDKQINFKIFKNGKIQITGIPEETVAKECIRAFIQYIFKQKLIDSIIHYNNFRTVLINSDYFCGIQINRENLFKIMTKKLNLTVSYESENYPGVKVAYFYNKKYVHTCHEGTCACSKKCIGKGKSALVENNCKRITVAIFQSGKIIITGANSLEQIHCAYQFINKIIQDHYYFVVKKDNIEIKTYKIKVNSIKNYKDYETLLQM